MAGLLIHIDSLADAPLGSVARWTLRHLKRSPMVFVLHFKDFEGHELSFLPLLNDAERQKYIAIANKRDAMRFVLTQTVSKLLLAPFLDLKPSAIVFESHNNKPVISGAKGNLEYAVSSTDSLAVIAVDEFPLYIELESIDRVNKGQAAGKRILSEDEQIALSNSPDPKGQFCIYWTRKRAFIKVWGNEMADNIALVPAKEGEHQVWVEWSENLKPWRLTSFYVEQDHCCTVAYIYDNGKRSPLRYKVESDFVLKLLEKAKK